MWIRFYEFLQKSFLSVFPQIPSNIYIYICTYIYCIYIFPEIPQPSTHGIGCGFLKNKTKMMIYLSGIYV